MGSWCSSSSSSTTQIPQWLQNEYQGPILGQANQIAQTPYQPYTGQLTAGLNGNQQQAISNLYWDQNAAQPYVEQGAAQQNAGFNTTQSAVPTLQQGSSISQSALPYYQAGASSIGNAGQYQGQADSLAQQAAGPLQYQQYMSPYTQNVIDTSLAQINQQNGVADNQALGSAIQSGNAFGGDRAGVAQAQLASIQGINANATIAGLENTGFQTALSAAENQAGNENTAAGTIAGLGQQNINAGAAYGNLGSGVTGVGNSVVNAGNAISSAGNTQSNEGAGLANTGQNYQTGLVNSNNALLNAGTQQQATDQAADNANYQQYQNQVAFPYQQTGWLAGIASSMNPGSTTSGTSTPSVLSTVGLAAGGRVPRRANGGGVGGAEFPTAGGPLALNGAPGSSGLVPAPPMVQARAPLTAPTNNNNNNKTAPAQPTLIGGLQQIGNLIKPGSFSSPTGGSNSIIGGLSQGVNLGKQAVSFFNGLGTAAPGGVSGAVGSTSLGGAPLVAPTAANSMVGGLGDAASSVAGGIGDAAAGVAGGLGDAGAALLAFLSTGGAVKRYANGGGVGYLFPTAGGPTTVSSTPGGGGLIPAVRFSRNTFQTAPRGFGAPNPNPSHTAIDAADQINALVDGASKWFTSSNSATPEAATSSIGDANGRGGLYARGGVVPPNFRGFASGGPVEREAVPHNPGSGIKPSIGTIGIYGRGGASPSGLGTASHRRIGQGSLGFARGGLVPPGYADGGATDDDTLDFDQRIAPAVDAIADGTFDPVGANSTTLERKELKDAIPLPVARPAGLGVDPDVVNPNDPVRLDGTYAAGEPPMTPGLAAANYASNQDDAPGPIDAYAPADGAPAPGLGGVAAINRQAGIAPDSDNTSLAGYDSTQGNKGGLRGLQPGAPLQITPQGGLGQGRIAPPQSPPNTGNAPAPGLLGSIGLTKDGAGALLQGVAGFMSAAGKGTLLGGLGSAITSATGAMAGADKQRHDQLQKDFENQIQAATAYENQQKSSRDAGTADLVQDATGRWVPSPAKLQFLKQKHDLEEDKTKYGTIGFRDDGTPISGFADLTTKKVYLPGHKEEYVPSDPTQPANSAAETPTAEQIQKNGTININKAQSSAPYNYSRVAPVVEKGSDVPPPAPVAGKSPQTIEAEAEYFLQTGKFLTPPPRSSTVNAIQQQNYRTAVQNYANSLAASRGMTPAEVADGWRTAPAMTKFILGPDGRSTVALGTAERHLDTLGQYIAAYKGNDQPTLRRLGAIIDKQFGNTGATTIDAMSSVVGPEIVKALGVAGAGTESERSNFEHMFQLGGAQAQAAIAGITKLLGGQLEGKERQAKEVGVSQDRFKRLIGEDEYNKIKGTGSNAQSETTSVPPAPQRQVGTVYTTPKGPMKWMGNGWKQ